MNKSSQPLALSADPPNTAVAGQSVTFTEQAAFNTTGSITFKANGVTIGTVPVSNGVAQLVTSSLAPGSYDIAAGHAGTRTSIPPRPMC